MLDVVLSGRMHTGSMPVFEWSKAQIEACQSNHEPCKSVLHSMPDRVLYLGQGKAENTSWLMNDVILYEPSGETREYATLSHRWGDRQPIRLLRSNLEEFKARISWHSLPATFQQAITFIRRLQIQYVWIDSLCIIQDDMEDWRRQSTKMASIYEHSCITIAASVAENAEAGCFISPPAFMVGYVTDGINKASLQDPPAMLQVVQTSSTGTFAFVRGESLHSMPSRELSLLNRGWVYQERLLSPRILHFADDLIFECSCRIECYCKKTADAVSRSIRSHPPKLQHSNALGKGPFKAVGGTFDDYAYRWCAIIQEYSCLDLTNASDRLPALAGLAKQMAGYMQAQYMAGIWRDSQYLPVYLAWQRNIDAPFAKNRSNPSWTWVTMPGGVSFPRGYPHLPTLAPGFEEFSDLKPSVIDIDFVHEGDKDFLSLKDGSIILNGYLLEVRMQRLQSDQRSKVGVVPTSSATSLTAVILDYEPDDRELQSEWNATTLEWVHKLVANPWTPDSSSLPWENWPENVDHDFITLVEQGDLQGILQCERRTWAFCLGKWQTDATSMDQFLVLERIDESTDSFQRVGIGECSVKTSFFRKDCERSVIILR